MFCRAAIVSALVTVLLSACGAEEAREPQRVIDPEPETLDGSESQEFEEDDIRAAERADLLVDLYCSPSRSEAQYVGCLSHVEPTYVCEVGTSKAHAAIAVYRSKTGEDPC